MNVDSTIIEICSTAFTMSDASKQLSLTYNTFKRKALKLNCWKPNQGSKGKYKGPDKTTYNKLLDVLSGKYPTYQSNKLRQRLFFFKLKAKQCEECKIENWNGKDISFHLHHIDGNKHNHIFENLKILCLNCHSQTENYGFKKRK